MGTAPNKYGVFEGADEEVLAHGKGWKAIARVANYDDHWFYGYYAMFRQGGASCGASLRNRAASRNEAIDKARDILIECAKGHSQSYSVDYSDAETCLRELLSQRNQPSFDF